MLFETSSLLSTLTTEKTTLNVDLKLLRFGMESVKRVVGWVTKEIADKSTSIIDIGCGNGMFLLKLVSFYVYIISSVRALLGMLKICQIYVVQYQRNGYHTS